MAFLPKQTIWTHPLVSSRGHVMVWPGTWTADRIMLEIAIRQYRAQAYITDCHKRDFIRCACWTAAWCLFCWLV